jgi:hypothetical protein
VTLAVADSRRAHPLAQPLDRIVVSSVPDGTPQLRDSPLRIVDSHARIFSMTLMKMITELMVVDTGAPVVDTGARVDDHDPH